MDNTFLHGNIIHTETKLNSMVQTIETMEYTSILEDYTALEECIIKNQVKTFQLYIQLQFSALEKDQIRTI